MQGQSIYERLGGEPAVRLAVKKFYERMLADENMMEFFEGVNMDKLKAHQVNMFTFALGGPNNYAGKDMRKAHENMKLKDIHMDILKKHLGDTLLECGAYQSEVQSVMDLIESMRNDVLNR